MEHSKTNIAYLPQKRAEIDETAHLKKYIMWENKSNICWLDASMALIAHNKVMKRASQVSPQSKISHIINTYADIISTLNDTTKSSNQWLNILNLARSMLSCLQDTTLQYLSPILKYKPGDPDSAFCSLYNLLLEDPIIKDIFEITWISEKTCTNCNYHIENTKSKPLITLSKIHSFDPINPTVLYNCNCGKSEQIMKFTFVTLPACLIFHFENGAGHEKPPLKFVTQGREYYLTGIMTHEKSQESNINHFISWVRDLFVDKWLDCNDLNTDLMYFNLNFPDIRFEDVSFYVYESFDDLGTIRGYKVINIKNSQEDIPCIDISEEAECDNSISVTNVSKDDKNPKKQKVSSTESEDVAICVEMDSSKSQKDMEYISDEKISQPNSVQISEVPCSKIKDAEHDKDDEESMKKTIPGQDTNIQNEDKTIDCVFQDLGIYNNKSVGDANERVNQTEYNNKSSLEDCKLDDQINTCYNRKQIKKEVTASTNEEKKLEDTLPFKKITGIKVKKDEQNKALLPVKELHISDIGDEHEDIKADIAKSGTSYVKVSFRRRKHPGFTFLRKKSEKSDNKPASDDTKTNNVRKSPKSVQKIKTLKRNRNEELDTVPEKRQRKNPKSEQTLERLQSNIKKEDKSCLVCKKDNRSSFQKKSVLQNNADKKKVLQKPKISNLISKDNKNSKKIDQVLADQLTSSNVFPTKKNPNAKNSDEGKILRDFKNIWSSHLPGCNCEHASVEETIDVAVDFTFAYLSKLSHRFRKPNFH